MEDGVEGDFGDGEGILKSHLLAGTLIDKLVAVAEKLPELMDLFHRNVAGGDDVKLEKVSDPHGIFVIGLLPFDSPDVFRVGDNAMGWPSRTLKMGIQYLPVDSMQTSEQLCLRSQSRQALRSELKVANRFFL